LNPRTRRLQADYEKIREDFDGHPCLEITTLQGNPPERYQVVYHIKGYQLISGGAGLGIREEHVVLINLHNDYPRQKPLCQITTPIFHPNFRGDIQQWGNVCIGDYWGAGETLSDVIVQIGEMIQYRTYNPYSPLDKQAAVWALSNQHCFPVGEVDLWQPETSISRKEMEIEWDDDMEIELN